MAKQNKCSKGDIWLQFIAYISTCLETKYHILAYTCLNFIAVLYSFYETFILYQIFSNRQNHSRLVLLQTSLIGNIPFLRLHFLHKETFLTTCYWLSTVVTEVARSDQIYLVWPLSGPPRPFGKEKIIEMIIKHFRNVGQSRLLTLDWVKIFAATNFWYRPFCSRPGHRS